MAETRGLEIGDILAIESNSMNSNGSYDWSFQVVGFYTAKQIKAMRWAPLSIGIVLMKLD